MPELTTPLAVTLPDLLAGVLAPQGASNVLAATRYGVS